MSETALNPRSTKSAALSPAIQALEQQPTEGVKKQHFEGAFTEQAYQLFGSKFPDLVESIVTLRVLDSDPDAGTALGAFIISLAGEMLYVPAVFVDNQVQPLEITYVKSKDKFLPLTPEWLEEIQRGSVSPLGQAEKLPETTPTDVDIRNLVVPPTTGRYSYASVTATEKIAAASTHPLGRALCKRAEEIFDPAIWEGFVTEFSRTQGVTPGVALDQGQMDLNILAKMFKSHQKTWTMPQEAQAEAAGLVPGNAQGAPQGAPQTSSMPPQGMAQGAAPSAAPMPPQGGAPAPMPAPGSMAPKIAGMFSRAGHYMDEGLESAALGGVLGGAGGVLTGVYDDSYNDLGARAMRGAVGGAAGGAAGSLGGHFLNSKHPALGGHADEIGMMLGTGVGAISAARPDAPAGVDPSMYRYASVDDKADLVAMLKHAQAAPRPRTPLLRYLDNASNNTKTAFAKVLQANPKLLKKVASLYGTEPLLESLRVREVKTAGMTQTSPKGLRVADGSSDFRTFGKKSPMAFRGVALRGYFYDEEGRKTKNTAVTEQPYRDGADAREGGVYKIYKPSGKTDAALVLCAPADLLSDGDTGRSVPVQRNIPGTETVHREPDSMWGEPYGRAMKDVTRSHKLERLCIFGDGKYIVTSELHGEQGVESDLEGAVAKRVFDETKPSKPSAGNGCFVYKTGMHYQGTLPVKLSKISTDSNGVVRGEFDAMWADRKFFIMDPSSPSNRLRRPAGESFVVIPAGWTWVPLTTEASKEDYLLSASGMIALGLQRLGQAGAEQVSVLAPGAKTVSVNGNREEKTAECLANLATTYDISAADAEAIIKIAQVEGRCRAMIVPKAALTKHAALVKRASPIDQAFSETMSDLGTQLATLQGQLQVLETVQQRAQALSGDPAAMQQTDPSMQQPPQDPNQAAPQQAPQGQDPAMAQQQPAAAPQGQDPAMAQQQPAAAPQAPQGMPQGQDPAMAQGAPQGMPQGQDPAMAQGMPQEPAQPPLPVMATEGPSSTEIAQQVNPEFLDQAAGLESQGVFDTSAIMELERAAGRTPGANAVPVSEYTGDLIETVDDLGRTLLMLQLRAPELREQLSDQGYKDLEQQVRNMFQGLGKLMLDLNQNTASLNHAQPNELQ